MLRVDAFLELNLTAEKFAEEVAFVVEFWFSGVGEGT